MLDMEFTKEKFGSMESPEAKDLAKLIEEKVSRFVTLKSEMHSCLITFSLC